MPLVRMTVPRIGPAFRVKRRLLALHFAAELPHHIDDDVIFPNAQATIQDFGGQVPVSQVPGDAIQVFVIIRRNVSDGLRFCVHEDHRAILQFETVAVPDRHGTRQVEQELAPGPAGHGYSSPVPLVEIKLNSVGGNVSGYNRADAGGAYH